MTSPNATLHEESIMSNAQNLTENLAHINTLYQDILATLAEHYQADPSPDLNLDVVQHHLFEAFIDFVNFSHNHPDKIIESQFDLFQNYATLFSNTAEKWLEATFDDANAPTPVSDAFTPNQKDRRFSDDSWNSNFFFDFLKQSYLLNSQWLKRTSEDFSHTINTHSAKVGTFYLNHLIDALSPSNYLLTNPEAIRRTLESNGENLIAGLTNLLSDLKQQNGPFHISMCDPNAFTIGENIACTEGKIVFENNLLQLIQYTPTTQEVYKTPIFIVAPWINKYYILDMQPHNSLVKWLVDQGHTVFITSWVNPGKAHHSINFEDYLRDGFLASLDVIEDITGNPSTNVLGYCLGGTLASIGASYLTHHKQPQRIKSLSLITTLIDFASPGDLGLFVDDIQLDKLAKKLDEQGYFNGTEMSNIFRTLRANDLIWSFVVKNYLFGDSPFAFDLLYWNSDATHLPSAMHYYYLKHMYHQNDLKTPNALTMCDTPVDITQIDLPCYMISTIEDHIAPWKSTYASTGLFKGPIRFVLSESGHVAGVVNPPSKKKYGYWSNDSLEENYPESPDEWFKSSKAHRDSWWNDWNNWLISNDYSGKKVTPPQENDSYPTLEQAPGKYVMRRIDTELTAPQN